MRNATHRRYLLILTCLIIVSSILLPAATSAVLNNGKNSKNAAVSKNTHQISLKNGFHYRGGIISGHPSGMHLNTGYLRFVKGKTIYLIPYHIPSVAAGTASCEK